MSFPPPFKLSFFTTVRKSFFHFPYGGNSFISEPVPRERERIPGRRGMIIKRVQIFGRPRGQQRMLEKRSRGGLMSLRLYHSVLGQNYICRPPRANGIIIREGWYRAEIVGHVDAFNNQSNPSAGPAPAEWIDNLRLFGGDALKNSKLPRDQPTDRWSAMFG